MDLILVSNKNKPNRVAAFFKNTQTNQMCLNNKRSRSKLKLKMLKITLAKIYDQLVITIIIKLYFMLKTILNRAAISISKSTRKPSLIKVITDEIKVIFILFSKLKQ